MFMTPHTAGDAAPHTKTARKPSPFSTPRSCYSAAADHVNALGRGVLEGIRCEAGIALPASKPDFGALADCVYYLHLHQGGFIEAQPGAAETGFLAVPRGQLEPRHAVGFAALLHLEHGVQPLRLEQRRKRAALLLNPLFAYGHLGEIRVV